MSSFNKVILMGRLAGDPEVRYTQSGKAVANFTIATDNGRKGDDKITEWNRCVAWEKTAELVKEHFGKGKGIMVEGTLRTRSWEKDGVERKSTEIQVFRVTFLPDSRAGTAPTPRNDGAGPNEGDVPW